MFSQTNNMTRAKFRSYVAIGDSLSEGLGDFTFDSDRRDNGWTDRLASMLSREASQAGLDFEYANLALRGSKLRNIMTVQLENALRLQPDLVTIMAGSNDLMTKQADYQLFPEFIAKVWSCSRPRVAQLWLPTPFAHRTCASSGLCCRGPTECHP